jgi:hypothetical protein
MQQPSLVTLALRDERRNGARRWSQLRLVEQLTKPDGIASLGKRDPDLRDEPA